MLSKRVIMKEWRDFARLRDANTTTTTTTNTNTCIYVDRPAPGQDPARAPASLTEPSENYAS